MVLICDINVSFTFFIHLQKISKENVATSSTTKEIEDAENSKRKTEQVKNQRKIGANNKEKIKEKASKSNEDISLKSG